MNDEARELLVKAALEGRKQIKGAFHGQISGECALGVLHLACHPTREAAVWCMRSTATFPKYREVIARFDLSMPEASEIAHRNDDDNWDFLTIARKVGRTDE